MRWTLAEFLFEMNVDQKRRTLFVEGNRDISFWKRFVPVVDRGDTVVYPISIIHIDGIAGGERGRLFAFADVISRSAVSARVFFFADADCDRILNRQPPENIVLTDGRDLESYLLFDDGLEELTCEMFGRSTAEFASVDVELHNIARPMGVLRTLSEQNGLKLPFQHVLSEDGGKRFTSAQKKEPRTINMLRLVDSLVRQGNYAPQYAAEIFNIFGDLLSATNAVPNAQIIHGKDLINVLSWYFDCKADAMTAVVFATVAARRDDLMELPSLNKTQAWIRQL